MNRRSSDVVVVAIVMAAAFGGSLGARLLHTPVSFAGQTATSDAASQQPNDLTDEVPLPQDPQDREARLAKNKRYNGGACDLVTLQPDHQCIDQVWPRTAFIPVEESDVVVLGQVKNIQPYLSTDHTHIYTEIKVSIERTFKIPPTLKLTQGKTLAIDWIGGSMKLRSGQTVSDRTRIDFLGKTHMGGRYVLFAKSIHGGKDLTPIRGYDLRNGQVFELTEDGSPGSVLISATPGVSQALSEESTFLQLVRTRAAKAKQGQ